MCKYGLSNLSSGLKALLIDNPGPPCSIIKRALESCPHKDPGAAPGNGRFMGITERLSNGMALLHNNRRKLEETLAQLRIASDDCADAATAVLATAMSLPIEAAEAAAFDTQAHEPPAHSRVSSRERELCERVLLLCASCEMLIQEKSLWELLAFEGRLDGDGDILHAISEALEIVDWDADAIYKVINGTMPCEA
jgi:hypothetical protein